MTKKRILELEVCLISAGWYYCSAPSDNPFTLKEYALILVYVFVYVAPPC